VERSKRGETSRGDEQLAFRLLIPRPLTRIPAPPPTMAPTTPHLDLQSPTLRRTHPAPLLKSISPSLHFSYAPSPTGLDSNLLILFHGLGDTCTPFFTLGQSLNLPQTAVLAIQGTSRIPLLEEEAWGWWNSFDSLGDLIPNPDPSETLSVLGNVLEYLTNEENGAGWKASQIHLFGFAQGGSCASELSRAWGKGKGKERGDVGSLVTVSGPLLSFPTDIKVGTKVLVVCRKSEVRMMGIGGFGKGFENVQEVVLGRGEGMLRGREEWEQVMR
jgi:hypothetical protein